jgi:internalin A
VEAVSTFKRLLALLAPYQQDMLFPPPATEAALNALEQYIGRALPPALVAVYKLCNGSPKVAHDLRAESLFYSYRFLSVEEVLSFAASWHDIRVAGGAGDGLDPIPSFPAGAVQDLYCCEAWVPIAHDGAGCHLAVDFAPGPTGVSGQIINFGPGDLAHFQLAPNFEAFLERVVHDYEKKKLHYFFGDSMNFVDCLLQQQKSHGD